MNAIEQQFLELQNQLRFEKTPPGDYEIDGVQFLTGGNSIVGFDFRGLEPGIYDIGIAGAPRSLQIDSSTQARSWGPPSFDPAYLQRASKLPLKGRLDVAALPRTLTPWAVQQMLILRTPEHKLSINMPSATKIRDFLAKAFALNTTHEELGISAEDLPGLVRQYAAAHLRVALKKVAAYEAQSTPPRWDAYAVVYRLEELLAVGGSAADIELDEPGLAALERRAKLAAGQFGVESFRKEVSSSAATYIFKALIHGFTPEEIGSSVTELKGWGFKL